MIRGLITVAVALGMAGGGFALVRQFQKSKFHEHAHPYGMHGAEEGHPELKWLRTELGLSDEQYKKAEALHVAYHPICEGLARRLEASHRRLAEATASATEMSAELESALADHAAVHLECQRAMLKHFYETAAVLSPEQAKRYLEKMRPLVFAQEATGEGHHH